MRARVLLHVLIAIALAVLLSLHFFTQPLRPLPDQGTMLQAAINHARGDGLSVQFADARDLTRIRFERLVYFPPGYPLLISTMLRVGFDVDRAVKIVNAVALVVGLFGWLLLAIPNIDHRWLRILFTILLVLACGGIIPRGGTTDVIFWAGMPWWILCLIHGRTRRSLLIVAALINAALISVRWAAVVLTPVAVLAMMPSVTSAIVVALPPTLAYFAIGAINRH
ncbi:MAG TPA: hypothetical protein VMU84_09255, partial [Thermoanaerobaculia bacterium]|nr:hypothetical protein [Thermoanaerobaculia bacterium]